MMLTQTKQKVDFSPLAVSSNTNHTLPRRYTKKYQQQRKDFRMLILIYIVPQQIEKGLLKGKV